VAADSFSLRRAFLNVLDNAIKYGGSEVTISVAQSDNSHPEKKVIVKISDNGPGIPEEDLGRLTERFYRVDKARSRSLGGTGLGLAIVKHIVHRHQGELSISSQQGAGTSVLITLPILETQENNDTVNTATKT
jgi:two-component system phosphate regulon sensor histidine kinase PhoR